MKPENSILVTSTNPRISKILARIAQGLLAIPVARIDLHEVANRNALAVLSYCRNQAEMSDILSAHWQFASCPGNQSSPCGTLVASSPMVNDVGVGNELLRYFGFGVFPVSDLASAIHFLATTPEFSLLRGTQHQPFWLLKRRLKHMWHGRFVRKHSATLQHVLHELPDSQQKEAIKNSLEHLVKDYTLLLEILNGATDD